MVRVVHALTVRSDDADATAGRVPRKLLLQTASVPARFGETSGDDDGRADFALAELENGVGDGGRRNDDNGEIGAGWYFVDRFDRRHSEDDLSLGIYRDDLAAEARVENVLEDLESFFLGFCGGADDGDAIGAKKRLEGITHGF